MTSENPSSVAYTRQRRFSWTEPVALDVVGPNFELWAVRLATALAESVGALDALESNPVRPRSVLDAFLLELDRASDPDSKEAPS